jgi:hypothetical protein
MKVVHTMDYEKIKTLRANLADADQDDLVELLDGAIDDGDNPFIPKEEVKFDYDHLEELFRAMTRLAGGIVILDTTERDSIQTICWTSRKMPGHEVWDVFLDADQEIQLTYLHTGGPHAWVLLSSVNGHNGVCLFPHKETAKTVIAALDSQSVLA